MTDKHIQLGLPIVVGLIAFAAGWFAHTTDSKPVAVAPKAIQWIGKLAAGDGASAVFMCREIEVGLGDKGELLWRRVNVPTPQVMPLKSTPTNAEAKP